MKSITCYRCNGTGEFQMRNGKNVTCVICRGNGAVNEDRLIDLKDNYWPRKLAEGKVSQYVFQKEIERIQDHIDAMDLIEPPENDDPFAIKQPKNPGVKVVEITDLLARIGGDTSITSSLLTVSNRAKKKNVPGRLAWLEG